MPPACSLITCELEFIVGPGPRLFEVRWSDPEIEKHYNIKYLV